MERTMERLTIAATFQKSIELLKNTECSQKEKLALFAQIADCIESPALRTNTNYLSYVSTAVTILLMFCEELDSVTRMSAEENLNRIVRFSTPSHIVRIQYDLFHEIKKNGNDRSLRIALNLFGHYIHLIKQRKIKPYATNLLPCILSIAKRREQQLIETLSEFVVNFCENLQICLNESEVLKLMETFIGDAVTTECAVKRRCGAANAIRFVEHSRRPDIMAKHALTTCLDTLVKEYIPNNIVGALGLLRVLLPVVLRLTNGDHIVIAKTIEIVEFCLHLLHDPSHTIINAALECLNVIFDDPRPRLKHFLCCTQLKHMEILRKRRTLKHQIFRTKSSTSSIEFGRSKNNLFSASYASSPVHANQSAIETESGQETSFGTKRMHATGDEKALLTCSDIEMESFKTSDFDTSRVDLDRGYDSSAAHSPAIGSLQRKISAGGDTISLKSQKSTDSIGSFFTSILAHPNTETVSKFFRGGAESAHPSTPKPTQSDCDNISVISMGSQMSMNSHNSSTFDLLNKTDESLPEIEILTDLDIDAIQIGRIENAAETTTLTAAAAEQYCINERVLFIGHIANQPIVHYAVRLIAMKFLLAGTSNELIDDKSVRVSIKSLSLVVIAHCVALWPTVLSLTMEKCDDLDGGIDAPKSYQSSDDADDSSSDTIDNEATSQNVSSVTADADVDIDAGKQLVIKDDHFGQSDAMTSSYFDFMLPLSKSADHVLLTQLNSSQTDANRSRNQRLNTNLSELLSKSDIVPSTSRSTEHSPFRAGSVMPALPSKAPTMSTNKYIIDRCCGVDIELQLDAPLQCIEDVLLYSKHSDPILRANVQLIAGNYLAAALNDASIGTTSTCKFLRGDVLISLLFHALKDDIHVVVKQSLNSVKNVLPALLSLQDAGAIFETKNDLDSDVSRKLLALNDADCVVPSHRLIEQILDQILFVHNNKYWVVQNSYADFIAKLDFDGMHDGTDVADNYRDQFMSHIYFMLGDNDQRVRNVAADALSEVVERYKNTTSHGMRSHDDQTLLNELIVERIFADLPSPLSQLMDDGAKSSRIGEILGKCLFHLSNLLLEIECKQRQFGVIKSIVKLLQTINPIAYHDIWNEFNIVEVSLSLMTQNYATGTDLACHSDLILISSYLLAARLSGTERASADRKLAVILVEHNLKLANIFHHIFSGQKPLFIPKGQKNDIFINAKELQALNSRGYFGNDYFYLKIYKMIKVMHDNFKITITADTDAKLLALLRTCLQSLSLLLEVLDPLEECAATLKLIEETLGYLTTFLQHVPIETVECTKRLLKYMFSMNFACCRGNYDWFLGSSNRPFVEVFERLRNFNEFPGTEMNDAPTAVPPLPVRSGQKLLGFATSSSSSSSGNASDDHVIGHSNVKLFEPIVIQCLKLFTKSDCDVQAMILDMICQVLEFRVSYCLLDANGIFIEFILKLLEMIETGTVRNSHIVIPHIIKFLFYLSKQKENTLVTIPKIINVTDTLLANSVTKNGCIEALRELAYEFYVRQSIGDADDDSLTPAAAKELNTQKEVAFSMLLKFIENPMIQKVIYIVLLNERKRPREMHTELAGCLMQLLTDHKYTLNDIDKFILFDRLMANVHGHIGGEKIVEILLRKSKMESFHDIAILTWIVSTIVEDQSEPVFISHVRATIEKLGLGDAADAADAADANNFIWKHFLCQISSGFSMCEQQSTDKLNENEPNVVFRTTDEHIQVLGIFAQFLVALRNIWTKFDVLSSDFHRNSDANEELIEQAIALLVRSSSAKAIADAKLKILDSMLAILSGGNVKEVLAEQLNKLNDANRSDDLTVQIRIHLIAVLLKLPLNADDVSNLLRDNFIELTRTEQGRQFVILSNADAKYSTEILEKLQSFVRTKSLHTKTLRFALDAIAGCNEAALPLALHLLLDDFLLHPKPNYFSRSILLKRTFSIFDQLLGRLANDDGMPDMEVFENAVNAAMVDRLTQLKVKYASSDLFKLCAENVTNILNIYENNEDGSASDESAALCKATIVAPVDEEWLLQQAEYVAHNSNSACVYRLLSEIRNESKLQQILASPRFDRRILTVIVECSFDDMVKRFKQDCFQHNPHMNYLKIPLVLRLAIDALVKDIESFSTRSTQDGVDGPIETAAVVLTTMVRCIERTECECLVYVEAQFVEKFIAKHLLRAADYDAFVRFVGVCLTRVQSISTDQSNEMNRVSEVRCLCECIHSVLRQRHIVAEINSNPAKYESLTNALVPTVYDVLKRFLASAAFQQTYALEHLLEQQRHRQRCEDTDTEAKYAKAIFIGKFVECCYSAVDEEKSTMLTSNVHHVVQFRNLLISLAISALRIDVYYFFAVTPYEVIPNFDWDLSNHRTTNRLPSLPIDYLNDVEIVEKLVRRINIFGFLSRTNFEEFFMSLLLLINKPTDYNVVDAQEQYHIKSICLSAIVELLLSCKMFTTVGRRDAGRFHHIPRLPRPKADSIGLKKLYKLQTLFPSGPSIFYMPNLERHLTECNGHSSGNNIIGSHTFAPNQCELNVIWHIIEEQPFASPELNVSLKNMRYFLEKSTVDMNSCVQVIFDVFTQLIEENCALVLPQLTKFCEICENREQFRWIKNAMTKLHESVHAENAVCHKHIIYCLCKSYSIMVPSTSELNQLCTIINGYLKSSHLFVRTAALRGLLCLLESAAKTNTTIGGLSEDILILRTLIIGYIRPHGIVEESSMLFSDEHTILVWTLNFYLIELTTKFVPDCNLLANSIISANNILKRTAVLEQYLCILHGLERLVIVNVTPKYLREKIEKVALDLVKLENETYSLAALKLLVTCMYMDCVDQLENTELSNGIVQDEPEVILRSTEKIDILFNRIKVSTTEAAHIYGSVLCQLTCDLVPPKELLTKVIKELLTISQPHCEVIAKVLFQVFRSAIDSSYLPLLQDWLICSLPNFLVFSVDKTIWCLTVIFISASINLQLIKIFPEVVAKYDELVDETMPMRTSDGDAIAARRRLQLFCLACKDFHTRLSAEQKNSFRTLFSNVESQEIQLMLSLL